MSKRTMKLPVKFVIQSTLMDGEYRIYAGYATVFGETVAEVGEWRWCRSENAVKDTLYQMIRERANEGR